MGIRYEAGRFAGLKGALQLIGIVAFSVLGLILVGLSWYGQLVRPYTWTGGIVSQAKANGWELAIERTSRNIFPWTWVVPFPGGLGFVQSARVVKRGEFIVAPMFWIIREDGTDVIEPHRSSYVLKCATRIYAVAQTDAELGEILSGGGKNWYNMDDELIGYFCKSSK
jgi:hypothetical protein